MPLSSGIMVFEVRGGLISGYFRSKFGISLGMHFGDHLDLILTSFWSHFGVIEEPKVAKQPVENQAKNVFKKRGAGKFWVALTSSG